MKKKFLVFISIVVIIGVTALVFNKQNSEIVSDVNLKNLKIDNISIGSNVEDINLSNYKMTSWRFNDYDYNFNNIAIKHDKNGNIIKIHGKLPEVDIIYEFKNIKDVINYFDSDYKELDYDREQGIKVIKYKDSKNSLGVEFMYSSYDDELVRVELYRLDT